MSTQQQHFLTPEEYLAIEREAEYKSEYFAGEMFAMAGAREPHNVIAMNTRGALWLQFRSRPCRSYGSDMRVHTASGLCTYPDISALCGEPRFEGDSRDILLNPTLIVEVLSPSTEAYDRGRKFEHYRSVASLNTYLMLASDHVQADLYVKEPDGRWLLTSAGNAEDVLKIETIARRLPLADLYEKVEF